MEPEHIKQIQSNTKSLAELATASAIVARDIGYMRQEMEKLITKIDALNAQFVTKSEYEDIEQRLNKLESLKDWIVRLVLGAVIMGLLALLGLKA